MEEYMSRKISLKVVVVMALALAVVGQVSIVPAANANSVTKLPRNLNIKNIGSKNMVVCKDWNFLPGVKTAKSCPGSTIGTLKKGQTVRKKFGWKDADAIYVPLGYTLYRQHRTTTIVFNFSKVYKPTKKGKFVKVSPSLASNSKFKLVRNSFNIPTGGGSSW